MTGHLERDIKHLAAVEPDFLPKMASKIPFDFFKKDQHLSTIATINTIEQVESQEARAQQGAAGSLEVSRRNRHLGVTPPHNFLVA